MLSWEGHSWIYLSITTIWLFCDLSRIKVLWQVILSWRDRRPTCCWVSVSLMHVPVTLPLCYFVNIICIHSKVSCLLFSLQLLWQFSICQHAPQESWCMPFVSDAFTETKPSQPCWWPPPPLLLLLCFVHSDLDHKGTQTQCHCILIWLLRRSFQKVFLFNPLQILFGILVSVGKGM